MTGSLAVSRHQYLKPAHKLPTADDAKILNSKDVAQAVVNTPEHKGSTKQHPSLILTGGNFSDTTCIHDGHKQLSLCRTLNSTYKVYESLCNTSVATKLYVHIYELTALSS